MSIYDLEVEADRLNILIQWKQLQPMYERVLQQQLDTILLQLSELL